MNSKLDLRFNGKLNPEICQLFNDISQSLIPKFNELVSEISQPYKNSLDWWVQGPASRNTYSSSFFHYYCSLHFIQHLIENNKFSFSDIIVDSLIFRNIIKSMLDDADIGKCSVRFSYIYVLKNKYRQYFSVPILFLKKIIQFFIARLNRNLIDTDVIGKQLVLIDTFMISGYTEDDRWYGSLWENLADKIKSETYFVPTIVLTPLREMAETYRRLRTNARNFLIKEDYLKLSDVFFAFGYKNRLRRIKIGVIKVLEFDLSSLIQDELDNSRDVLMITESILLYRFIKRIHEAGINVRLAIDWFEGQSIDKAWNLGFNKYYLRTKTIGYRAYESFPFYLCSYPLKIEKEASVLPNVIAVQGKGTIETVREFVADLDIMVIPSFKSQHVWKYKFRKKTQSMFTVLIALPISMLVSVRILKRIILANDKIQLSAKAVKYIIKPHPTHFLSEINDSLGDISEPFFLSEEKSFPDLLHKSNLLITEASSASMEALACGIPVIIVENEEGLTFDPVPNTIPVEVVSKTRTTEHLVDAMQRYINATSDDLELQRKIGKKIRADYFEPLSKEGLDKFLDIGVKEKVKHA